MRSSRSATLLLVAIVPSVERNSLTHDGNHPSPSAVMSQPLRLLRKRVTLLPTRLQPPPAFIPPSIFRPPSLLRHLQRPPQQSITAPYAKAARTRRLATRRLATHRTVHPPSKTHHLKGDVTPTTSAPSSTLPVDSDGLVILKSLTLPELEAWVISIGEKPFRARQLWRWLYDSDRLAASFEEMTDLAISFRTRLSAIARIDAIALDRLVTSTDGTRKMTFRLDGGGVVETVLIPADGRTTICVSSQWGCALNCQFCLTGRTGFKRSLTTGEIVDQIVHAKRLFEKDGRISNCVFMGEGEPAHNLDNVLRAVDTMLHPLGLQFSHNKVTVSTSGLVPEIRRFAATSRANLAVSLHATNNDLRNWLMPINRKYPLEQLMQTLRDVFPRNEVRQQKVFFQYVMLRGVNDSLEDAKELLRLTAGVPCKVNLIHFNTHDGTEFEASDEDTMLAFQDYLVKKGMTVTIRKSRGDDEMMACGQLGKLGPVQPPRMKIPEKYAHVVRRDEAMRSNGCT